MPTGLGNLPYGAIQSSLAEVLQFYPNSIDRQGATGIDHNAAKVTYLGIARLVRHTWAAIAFLIAEHPEDYDRKPEFLMVLSPLLRSICDACLLAVVLRTDTERKLDLYVKGGLFEAKEILDRTRERFGTGQDVHSYWIESIRVQENQLAERCKLAGVSLDEIAGLKRFPHAGQYVAQYRKGTNASLLVGDDGDFASYLETWYYKVLSQHAHLSFNGLLALQGGFFTLENGSNIAEHVKTQRSIVAFIGLTLLLSTMSEIELKLQFGGNGKNQLRYLWTMIGESFPDAKEIYGIRYQENFN